MSSSIYWSLFWRRLLSLEGLAIGSEFRMILRCSRAIFRLVLLISAAEKRLHLEGLTKKVMLAFWRHRIQSELTHCGLSWSITVLVLLSCDSNASTHPYYTLLLNLLILLLLSASSVLLGWLCWGWMHRRAIHQHVTIIDGIASVFIEVHVLVLGTTGWYRWW